MKYLKVWTDFIDVLETLEDAEVGRLFRAMLQYAATGEEPGRFDGNERFIWPVARRDIDITATIAEKNRENGLKPKSKTKRDEATESETKRDEANGRRKEKKRNEMKGKEKETTFIDTADAIEIQLEQDRVLDAAEDAGFKCSNSERASLIRLYADNGLDRMLDGIASCVRHGVTTIAYLEGVLKGEPKKAKADVSAQKYTQRDYSNEQDEAMLRMIKGAAI